MRGRWSCRSVARSGRGMRSVCGYPIACPHALPADAGAAGWMSRRGRARCIDVRGVGCSARRIPRARCASVWVNTRRIGVHWGRRARIRWPCTAAAVRRTIRLRWRRIVGRPRWRRSRVICRGWRMIGRSRWVISRGGWMIGRSRRRFVLCGQGYCRHGNRQQN